MKKTFITFLSALLIFLLITIVYLFVQNYFQGDLRISGLVQYHKADLTISADAPEGYFIESSAIGRIYLRYGKNENLAELLDKNIVAKGLMSNRLLCGNDGGLCYPVVKIEMVEVK